MALPFDKNSINTNLNPSKNIEHIQLKFIYDMKKYKSQRLFNSLD